MTITILCGLPASGKSTKADELLRERCNTIRVNRDLLRECLHFGRWSGANEKATVQAARLLTKHFLTNGRHVVIDETTLNPSTLQGWKDLGTECGAKVEVIDVDTPIEVCLERDRTREKRVGKHVIVGMAMQYGLYPTPENGIVIVDIDGTLADISHRRHFVAEKPKDWKGFFEAMGADTERRDVVNRVLEHQSAGREIFLVSGRPETYRKETEQWLASQMEASYITYQALFMRPANDSREDSIIKREIFERYFKGFDVVEVIDDRPQVLVRTWGPLLVEGEIGAVRDVGSNTEFVEERKELNYWTT